LALLQPLPDDLASFLHLRIGERVAVLRAETEPGLDRVEVEVHALLGVEPELQRDLLAVVLLEVGVDLRHLTEDVQVGSERGGRPVEEHHVLHEEHELLRRPRAVAQQLLRELAQLVRQRVGRHVGRVGQCFVEPEVRDDCLEVGVGRERPEVPERGELAQHIAVRAEHEQAEERQPLHLVEPSDDAEVEERGAAVRHREEVAAVQVAVEHTVEQRALEERDQA
jgi:hypothetical protein